MLPLILSVLSLSAVQDTAVFAAARMRPTDGNHVRGVVQFRRTHDGIVVLARLTGLTTGPHAYHVHVHGDCSAGDGSSAGTHFDFIQHGAAANARHVTGNLGDLRAGREGRARDSSLVRNLHPDSARLILGRSVVIHARGNDHAKPPLGDAGVPVACGVIEPPAAPRER